MIYVIDASVAVKWFVREDLHGEAVWMLDQAAGLHAPDWIVLEVAHAALKKWRRGEIGSAQAEMMVQALPGFLARLHRSAELTVRAFAIAMATRHPVYDCLYVACAEAADGVVVTADADFVRATKETEFAPMVRHLTEAMQEP